MNNKGFTLMELLVTIVIISFVLMIIYPSVAKIMQKNSNELYAEYEKMMVEYAKINPQKTKNILMLSELEDDGALNKIKEDGCNGYVTINRGITPNVYQAYITCGEKYQTENYNASLQTDA